MRSMAWPSCKPACMYLPRVIHTCQNLRRALQACRGRPWRPACLHGQQPWLTPAAGCLIRTSLRTKLYEELADQLTDIVVDAVLTIRKPDEPIDLFMVRSEMAPCRHKVLLMLFGRDTKFCWSVPLNQKISPT